MPAEGVGAEVTFGRNESRQPRPESRFCRVERGDRKRKARRGRRPTPHRSPYAELAELARAVLRVEPDLGRDALKSRVLALVGAAAGGSGERLLEAALPPALGIEPVRPALDQWGRAPWIGWQVREVPALQGLKPASIAPCVVEVVEAEGPVTVGRVFDLLRRASGVARMSSGLHDSLEAGLASAERQGLIVLSRGRRGEPDSRTLRTPSQPEVALRTPGEREAAAMPPLELVELASRVREALPEGSRAEIKRQVALLLGWGRYTQGIDELLERSLPTT